MRGTAGPIRESVRMLTDEQKRTIRLEEEYRAELREELASRRPRGLAARMWGLVNANIVV